MESRNEQHIERQKRRCETLLKEVATQNARMNDGMEKDAQQQRRRRQYGLEILTDKKEEMKKSTQRTVSEIGTTKNGKVEKEKETEEEVVISCPGAKREFKQNMKNEVFA